jgi:hypothetical protein
MWMGPNTDLPRRTLTGELNHLYRLCISHGHGELLCLWAEGASTHCSADRGGCSRGTVPIWVPGVRAKTTTAVAHRV